MKITLNPKEGSNAFNPVANVSLSEVIELLEIGAEQKLSAAETTVALPILESLKTSGDEFTLRDVITKFKAVDELASFADLCESIFLAGGDYSKFFTKSQAYRVNCAHGVAIGNAVDMDG
ncbi:hypothetical protein NMS01_003108 [Vibrio cholerae]|nr:hypothetical protein [Vibrio cholerae]